VQQVLNSSLLSTVSSFFFFLHIVGCDRPVLRDLVNHVVPSVANYWYDLGLQLLDPKYENELNIIEAADMKNEQHLASVYY